MNDDQARSGEAVGVPDVAIAAPDDASGAPAAAAAPPMSTAEAPGRGPWLTLAFVGLVGMLMLLGTTDVGAAASTLISGDPYACGGP